MGVAGTEPVTASLSQEITALRKDGNNFSVPATSAELVAEDKTLSQTQQLCGHVLLLLHQVHVGCCWSIPARISREPQNPQHITPSSHRLKLAHVVKPICYFQNPLAN